MTTDAIRPALAVLDVAGTVVHVGDAVSDALRAAFAPLGRVPDDGQIAAVRGLAKRDAVRRLVEALDPGCPDPASVALSVWHRFMAELPACLAPVARPIPGAHEAVAWLRREVGPVWLTSGFDRPTLDRVLAATGWDGDAVDGTVSADDVARGRPAPDLIAYAMDRAGVPDPGRVLVVGDTVADLGAAAAAKAGWVVGVLSGAHGRDDLARHPHSALLPSVADLREWVEGRGTTAG